MFDLRVYLKDKNNQKRFLNVLLYKFEPPCFFHSKKVIPLESLHNYIFNYFIPSFEKKGYKLKKLKYKNIDFYNYKYEEFCYLNNEHAQIIAHKMRNWLKDKKHFPKAWKDGETPDIFMELHPRGCNVQYNLGLIDAEIIICDFFLWNLGRLGYGFR